jgi:hypothetical protein
MEYAASGRAPEPGGRKGDGCPERRNGHRPRRLVEKLDGGVVRTKSAVRLAHKPAGSMNPTSGKADLFAFQITTLAMMVVALLRVTGPLLTNSKSTGSCLPSE